MASWGPCSKDSAREPREPAWNLISPRNQAAVARAPGPAVARSEFERVLGAGRFGAQQVQTAGFQPDVQAFLRVVSGGKRGGKAQG